MRIMIMLFNRTVQYTTYVRVLQQETMTVII